MENLNYKMSLLTERCYAKLHSMTNEELKELKDELNRNLDLLFNNAGDLSYLEKNNPNEDFFALEEYTLNNAYLLAALSLYDLDFYNGNKERFVKNSKHLIGLDKMFKSIAGHLANKWANCSPTRKLEDYFSDEFLKSKEGHSSLISLFRRGNDVELRKHIVTIINQLDDEGFADSFNYLYQDSECGLQFLDNMELKSYERFLKLVCRDNNLESLNIKKLDKNQQFLKENTESHVKNNIKYHSENGVDSYGMHLLKNVLIATKNEIFTKIEQAAETLKYQRENC